MKKKLAFNIDELKLFLDEKVNQYNGIDFIDNDPISIPHRYTKLQDIEIAGLLAATIAWGNRVAIVKNAGRMMELMDDSPYDFIKGFTKQDIKPLQKFVHRTFNSTDLIQFIQALKKMYSKQVSLEDYFNVPGNGFVRINHFRKFFVKQIEQSRTLKHISNPEAGSAAKRLNMFLRWMVRKDNKGVDFGCWKTIPMADLLMPLDVHTGNISRKLGLLHRQQNDAKAVLELTECLKQFDKKDPVKYDFALFGIGINEKII